ncbi:MAG: insulinase family protein [Candidatus Moranbacteria bacterium]|nr:insulinase family protein [Candidatus Moranbacteria bacterium]
MKFKKTKLKNGLRIITAPMTGTETATVVVMVGVGSRYETEKQAGLSHFIEHMMFKGTANRPTALSISSELDAIGGEFNAFTSKDATGYYAKADARHMDIALDVIFDMFLNSKLDQEEIDREKGTIIQELNMYEDNPMRSIGDVFEGMLYAGNNLGRDIGGYKETVKSFKRRDFVSYMKRFYVANDTVVSVAGKFNEKKIIPQIKKYFESFSSGNKAAISRVKENQKKPEIKVKFKKTDQTHFIVGTRAFDRDDDRRYALSLLSIILGGNMSSRLFIEVRERRGLAYYVRTTTDLFEDCGYIATQAGVEHENLEKALKVILEEYRKISEMRVSDEELKRAKEYVKGKSVMGLEASDEMALFLVNQEIEKGNILEQEEIFKRIDKVTADDIMKVAKEVFRTEILNLAVIGPHKNEDKLRNLLKL